MTTNDYRQPRCPHGWVDVTQCETCALKDEVERLRADRDSWAQQASDRAQDALDLVAAERERCAAKAGAYAQAWWSKHCASNKHMETTRAAHDDFCRLQADIRRA